MRARHILETVLYADDLAAMRHFYAEVLGLEVHLELDRQFVFFRCASQMLLVFNPAVTAVQDVASGPPAHGTKSNGHICFRSNVAEFEGWQRHLSDHDVAIERLMVWPNGGRSIYVRDPAGNSVEFGESKIWELPELKTLSGQRIVVATHNMGKLEEFAQLLNPFGVTAVPAAELGLGEPAETENTFAGNARIKALAAMTASGLIALSDDSGLCVDALAGEPGVHTADWAGPQRDWTLAMERVEDKLAAIGAVEPQQRHAEFVCTLCVMWPDGEVRLYEGRAPGHLVWPPRGHMGHGYDPMFVPDGETRTFAELDPATKNRISHRARALEKLVRDLV